MEMFPLYDPDTLKEFLRSTDSKTRFEILRHTKGVTVQQHDKIGQLMYQIGDYQTQGKVYHVPRHNHS